MVLPVDEVWRRRRRLAGARLVGPLIVDVEDRPRSAGRGLATSSRTGEVVAVVEVAAVGDDEASCPGLDSLAI